jgi:type IV pilus assembly protein PilM
MILGIDIGYSTIKVAGVNKKGKSYELSEWDIFEIPEGVISSEGIIDSEAFIKVLTKIPAKFNIKYPKVAFSVSGPANTAVRIIQVSFMDQDELYLNLPLELDKYIPFSVKEVYYDFYILEQSKKEKTMEVLIAVANKHLVNDFVNAFDKAEMLPVVVDIDSLSLFNSFEVNCTDSSTSAILNISENIINFIIARKNKPLYIRDIVSTSNINIEEADEDTVRNFADEISAEIYRQIEYFKTIKTEENVDKIYLTGLPITSPVFISSVEERLGQHVSIFDPFKSIKINKKIADKMQKYAHISPVSVGLSLRGTEKIR